MIQDAIEFDCEGNTGKGSDCFQILFYYPMRACTVGFMHSFWCPVVCSCSPKSIHTATKRKIAHI